MVDYSNVRSSGIEECGRAGTEPGHDVYTRLCVKRVLFVWGGEAPLCPDLDLMQLYQILTLHCTGEILVRLLLVPQSKDTPGKNQHFAQIFTALIQTASAECWRDFYDPGRTVFFQGYSFSLLSKYTMLCKCCCNVSLTGMSL